ncbi:Conserved hypothetical protein [Shewanella piezotolerans WP3]|uniref:Major facilitator superfamily (MFS) profile domain-containing protein n=1 Tax=Shewanella piezotolerans (strain WP3 / JCM 13877) TaxID=225849 RepID=B8CRV4_SHEPW|nr:Conserved hypothetical protein [Shewanella piezotolerans WP3]
MSFILFSLTFNFKPLFNSEKFNITSRALAAIFAGYLTAATGSALLAIVIPLAPVQSTLTAMMLSFSIYTAAIIWVFSVKSHLVAWRDLLSLSGVFYLLIKLIG